MTSEQMMILSYLSALITTAPALAAVTFVHFRVPTTIVGSILFHSHRETNRITHVS